MLLIGEEMVELQAKICGHFLGCEKPVRIVNKSRTHHTHHPANSLQALLSTHNRITP